MRLLHVMLLPVCPVFLACSLLILLSGSRGYLSSPVALVKVGL